MFIWSSPIKKLNISSTPFKQSGFNDKINIPSVLIYSLAGKPTAPEVCLALLFYLGRIYPGFNAVTCGRIILRYDLDLRSCSLISLAAKTSNSIRRGVCKTRIIVCSLWLEKTKGGPTGPTYSHRWGIWFLNPSRLWREGKNNTIGSVQGITRRGDAILSREIDTPKVHSLCDAMSENKAARFFVPVTTKKCRYLSRIRNLTWLACRLITR